MAGILDAGWAAAESGHGQKSLSRCRQGWFVNYYSILTWVGRVRVILLPPPQTADALLERLLFSLVRVIIFRDSLCFSDREHSRFPCSSWQWGGVWTI